jgi:S-adenosylmethionine decarboxylase
MRTNTLICPAFMKNRSALAQKEKQVLGRHFTLEFYDCKKSKILSLKKIERIFLDAVLVSGETALKKSFNYLEEKGINGVITTSCTDFSIHGWAEYNYVTVDIFTCSAFFNINEITKKLENSLHSQNSILSINENRGIISSNAVKYVTPNGADNEHENSSSWEEQFQRADAWGLSSSIDIYDCDPELIKNADAIKYFVYELCDLIEMKRFGECNVVYFGENEKVAGYSMTQLIETSLILAHFANESNTVYLDVFSCKSYQPEVVSTFAQKFFKGKRTKLQVNIRQ